MAPLRSSGSSASWVREGSASLMELSFRSFRTRNGEDDDEEENNTMSESERLRENDRHMLKNLPGNNICMDCPRQDPGWASVTFGVMVCDHCSRAHR